MLSTSARPTAALIALLIALPLGAAGCAQQRNEPSEAEAQIDHDMSQPMGEGAHMTLTPTRTPTSADSIRAAALADTLRWAIAKYVDVRVAEADGFRRFAPRIKQQPVLHYTRFSWAVESRFAFDPAKPTSLLYRQEPDGSLRLIGAMYTAPGGASLDELDRRVPLSIAHWHLHTNLCVPALGQRARWTERRNGMLVFGPQSPIATRAACDAVGGRFLPHLFGWMVHANVLEGSDPATVWTAPHHHQHAS
jgi:hypothetical protein